jgi:hypothetical protein
MKEVGKKIKRMGLECLLTAAMRSMKDSGWTTCNMDKVSRHGEELEKGKQRSLEYSLKEKRMEKEGFNGKMDHTMMEIL